ncbi:hypothetical protein GCM10011391_08730 [Pullulanibacillus camelliae]|uniref:SHSP domain-containing protein n=1 Tax=Pullulanibacillus camelliae TaxID=1707096 RepID=A0A8J2VMP2_9BACL|nr:Hsp20/alpha crystallin family protein [Pullulanibacillus camelliae]GGE32323.1 hypothetical protein GCM10011391_08730 [Pullulanibacillus camelliae]
MDVDKLKQWLEVAQKFQGNDFWNDIFDEQKDQDPNEITKMSEVKQSLKQDVNALDRPFYALYRSMIEIIIVIDLPGVAKEDIQLKIAGNHLLISGHARPLYDAVEVLKSDRLNGPFKRTIPFPSEADSSKAVAKFDHGLLEIRMPLHDVEQHTLNIE